jgi:hypothetical protein
MLIRRIALTAAAAAVLAAGALAAPAAHASIAQPSCWALKYRCLAATPATPSPTLKYQTQPGNEWGDGPP